MFKQYMYFGIVFPLIKAITFMSEHVTTYCKTLQRVTIMQRVTIISTRYHMRYYTFFLGLEWVGAISGRLPHVTLKFIKRYILRFFLKN